MKLMLPFKTELGLTTGVIVPVNQVIRRTLSDMRGMYADDAAYAQILDHEGDRLIYEVYPVDIPEEEGQVLHSTTVLYPGKIGGEFHMTKGHFHVKRNRAEVYLGLSGDGYLLLETDEGEVSSVPMKPGTIAYVPPYWAHRTVNTGPQPFIFFAAWPGDSGHDYGTIEKVGFAKIMVERNGRVALIDNPRWAVPGTGA
jgi:glucose-6-phosphate isomerase